MKKQDLDNLNQAPFPEDELEDEEYLDDGTLEDDDDFVDDDEDDSRPEKRDDKKDKDKDQDKEPKQDKGTDKDPTESPEPTEPGLEQGPEVAPETATEATETAAEASAEAAAEAAAMEAAAAEAAEAAAAEGASLIVEEVTTDVGTGGIALIVKLVVAAIVLLLILGAIAAVMVPVVISAFFGNRRGTPARDVFVQKLEQECDNLNTQIVAAANTYESATTDADRAAAKASLDSLTAQYDAKGCRNPDEVDGEDDDTGWLDWLIGVVTPPDAVADPGVTPPSGGSVGAKVVRLAMSQRGDPYVWGACHSNYTRKPPPEGCSSYDCSGLAMWAWYWGSDKEVRVDGTTRAMYANRNSGKYYAFHEKSKLEPGDLILWHPGRIHHVAIYIGDNKFVHAPNSREVVKVSSMVGYYSNPAIFLRPKL